MVNESELGWNPEKAVNETGSRGLGVASREQAKPMIKALSKMLSPKPRVTRSKSQSRSRGKKKGIQADQHVHFGHRYW